MRKTLNPKPSIVSLLKDFKNILTFATHTKIFKYYGVVFPLPCIFITYKYKDST